MIKSIIVEDDPGYSKNLIQLLKKVEAPVDVLSISTNVIDALQAIAKYHPDVVFLDIELGAEKGFDLLKQVGNIDFDVIFTTSHINKYIREIRACAMSYLPKPYDISEINDAIKKLVDRKNGKIGLDQVKTLLANLHSDRADDKIIWLNKDSDYFPIEVRNIIYCSSENQYTYFFIREDGKKDLKEWITTKGIGDWESDLEHFKFCRIHNRYLINLKHVVKYTRGDGGSVLLSNGESLDVSKERKNKFLKLSGMK